MITSTQNIEKAWAIQQEALIQLDHGEKTEIKKEMYQMNETTL
jgi:hypothetical protein